MPKFTLEQAISLGVLLVGLAVTWASAHQTLMENRIIMVRVEEATKLIRDHQVNNEYLIDQHSFEIELLQMKSGLPVTNHRRASTDPR